MEKAIYGDKTFTVQSSVFGGPLRVQGDGVDVRYTYDGAGRPLTRSDTSRGLEETWAYGDVLGRVTQYTKAQPGQQMLTEIATYEDNSAGWTW